MLDRPKLEMSDPITRSDRWVFRIGDPGCPVGGSVPRFRTTELWSHAVRQPTISAWKCASDGRNGRRWRDGHVFTGW
jgi:hypothetical protein